MLTAFSAALLAVLVVFFCNSSASLEGTESSFGYKGLVVPATVGELLKSIKLVAERHLWDRDDFYTHETLTRIFGPEDIRVMTVPGKNLEFQLYGFERFLAPQPGDPNGLEGAEIFARKHVTRPTLAPLHGASDEFNHMVSRQFTARFLGNAAGLDFNTVINIFGSEWKENIPAENEVFMAITREPFNPPPPQPTGYMGNKIITYTEGPKDDHQELSLRFDSLGTLREIDSTTRYATP